MRFKIIKAFQIRVLEIVFQSCSTKGKIRRSVSFCRVYINGNCLEPG